MKNRKKAFTLIELLVVISIIALLLAILIPSLSKVKELAKRAVCGNQLKQIGQGVTSYSMKYNGSLPNILKSDGDEEYHPYVAYREDEIIPGGESTDYLPFRFGCLYSSNIIQEAKVFYCPSNTDPGRKYESYVQPMPWGSLPQTYNSSTANSWVRCGYEYFPVEKSPKMNMMLGCPSYLATKYDRLDPYLPYATDVLRTLDTMSHRYRGVCGVNALYPDGSLVFCNNQDVFRNQRIYIPGDKNTAGRLLNWDEDPSGGKQPIIYRIYFHRFWAIGRQDLLVPTDRP